MIKIPKIARSTGMKATPANQGAGTIGFATVRAGDIVGEDTRDVCQIGQRLQDHP
ncbi:hypothetical protein ACNKHL_00230 [Shigella flexneri]